MDAPRITVQEMIDQIFQAMKLQPASERDEWLIDLREQIDRRTRDNPQVSSGHWP